MSVAASVRTFFTQKTPAATAAGLWRSYWARPWRAPRKLPPEVRALQTIRSWCKHRKLRTIHRTEGERIEITHVPSPQGDLLIFTRISPAANWCDAIVLNRVGACRDVATRRT